MERLAAGEDRLDVEAIMEEIRRRVREKREQGYYSEEELGRLAELQLEPGPPEQEALGSPQPDEWCRQQLDQLSLLWDARVDIPISSHRRWVGRYIVWGKLLLRRLMRPYANMILSRQSAFNSNVLDLFRLTTSYAAATRSELSERLGAWNQELRESIKALQGMLVRAQEELGAVHEATVDLSRQADELRQEVAAVRQEALLDKSRLGRILDALEEAAAGKGALGERLRAEREHLADHSYFRFEQRFRGTSERIRIAQRVYLPAFAGARDVLDIGCGRGEFLELLRENGVSAQGVDVNEDMVHVCRQKGLNVTQAEASEFLSRLEDESLGGIFAAQVLEHLERPALVHLVRLCYRKLRKGAPLVVETVNPTSVLAATSNFYLDLSHVRPLHPEALKFLLEAERFRQVEVIFLSPVEDRAKLQAIPIGGDAEPARREMAELLNRNIEKLNNLLYGYQDYAVVARK